MSISNDIETISSIIIKNDAKNIHLIPRVDGEDVTPPAGLLATGPLDEGHPVGGGHGQAERVACDLVGVTHLQHEGHVHACLRHRIRLQTKRSKVIIWNGSTAIENCGISTPRKSEAMSILNDLYRTKIFLYRL